MASASPVPQLADELQQIMARIEPETKNQVRHQDLPTGSGESITGLVRRVFGRPLHSAWEVTQVPA